MSKHVPEYGKYAAIKHRGKRTWRTLWLWRPVVATSLYAHQTRITTGGGESK